jgi:hypothetical protein
MHVGYWWESHAEREHWKNWDIEVWIILIWILERYDVAVRTGLIRLRIKASGGLL